MQVTDRTDDDAIALGRDALERHEWQKAYDVLTEADNASSYARR